jgi:hypothetical protein
VSQAVYIEQERVLPTLNCRTWWETADNFFAILDMNKCRCMPPSKRLFVLSLYGIKARNYSSLNKIYFLASTTDKPASHLTPTEDTFKQHVLTAMYQTNI